MKKLYKNIEHTTSTPIFQRILQYPLEFTSSALSSVIGIYSYFPADFAVSIGIYETTSLMINNVNMDFCYCNAHKELYFLGKMPILLLIFQS